jgi:hypothetical protein
MVTLLDKRNAKRNGCDGELILFQQKGEFKP